ncbi:MAG: hypothetical protein O7E52_06850 [Candidatus Poribacteria bacterium]|nr:hypothetical protein [Candidatus Poribacteria bacterium]
MSSYKGQQIYEIPASFRDRLHKTLRARWREVRGSSVARFRVAPDLGLGSVFW